MKEKVEGMIEQKKLLHENVPNTLKDENCGVLCARAAIQGNVSSPELLIYRCHN